MARIRTPLEALEHWAATAPRRVFLRQPEGGVYRDLTWGAVREQVRRVAGALRDLGLAPGDRVAIFSKNCTEWFVADLAIQQGGYVSVPVYPTASEETIRYVLEHSDARAVFVGKLERPRKQGSAIPKGIPRLGFPYDTIAVDRGWEEMLAAEAVVEPPAVRPDDVMSIIYTSGSTGRPKGVVHTYASLSWAGDAIGRDLDVTAEDRVVSYLPLAHITERAYVEMGSILSGNPVAFVESIDTFLDDVKRARPTMFISVPRLWALFRERIVRNAGPRRLKVLLALPGVGPRVRQRIKAGLGLAETRCLGCGSAPVDPDLLRWYESVGIEIGEGWGMTENAAYGTVQQPFRSDKIGSVGRVALESEMKVAADGELLFKGPGLMQGYYRDEEGTRAAFTEDGFLRTGDLGHIDDDGYVFITGRTKDLFKTAKGLYVAPGGIERMLEHESVFDAVCVAGRGLAQPVALVRLLEPAARGSREVVRARLQAALARINEGLESHEKLGAVVVVADPWTVETGMMTPTLKLRREQIERRYAPLLRRVDGEKVFWQEEIEALSTARP